MDTIEITPARVDDAEQILAVQHAAYRLEAERHGAAMLPPLAESLDELIAALDSHIVLVARHSTGVATTRSDPVVGSVRALVHDDTAHIGRLAVRPDLHGRGIGRQLLWAIERSTTASVARYELFTGHRSARNLRMYERAGYRRIRDVPASEQVTLIYMEKATMRPGAGARRVLGAPVS